MVSICLVLDMNKLNYVSSIIQFIQCSCATMTRKALFSEKTMKTMSFRRLVAESRPNYVNVGDIHILIDLVEKSFE